MEMLIEKTRKNVNIKQFLIDRRLTKGCVSFEIRIKDTAERAEELYKKYIEPMKNLLIDRYPFIDQDDDRGAIGFYRTSLVNYRGISKRSIGIVIWSPTDVNAFPDDLIFHHGSYYLYVTNVTNN